MDDKQRLREAMRAQRHAHVAALPDATRGLLFLRPPSPVAAMAPEGSVVGLYHALPTEARAAAYARWFFENGRTVALPWFAERGAPMQFREWHDPYEDDGLEVGPYGALQPLHSAGELHPHVLFVPLLAFTGNCDRLGQGGGHYDRWLADHPGVAAIGLAWDCQLIDRLPIAPHDRPLRAVVTPTRLYEREA